MRRRPAFAPTSLSRTRLELLMGLEPMTSSLPRRCSTTELQQPGRPKKTLVERAMGIEPTPSAWKAEALPLSYARPVPNISFGPVGRPLQQLFRR